MANPEEPEAASPLSIRDVIRRRLVSIWYQPIVDLFANKIIGYEAFVRSIPPCELGPLALFEQAVAEGAVGELGRYLRRLAVDGCPDWPLFLNIVPQELDYGLLLDPADPIFTHQQQVYLEITESVPVHYYELCHDVLTRARAQGLSLVVDDFGAGYSNLQYIADLAPDIVKLDRGLIAGLPDSPRRSQLVENIARLCLDMGSQVVAEGIETVEELNTIVQTGVPFGQGFLLARPAPTPPVPTWPSTWDRERAYELSPTRKVDIQCIDNPELRPFLDRRRRPGDGAQEVDLNTVLTQLLERANAFVPSAAGTIFLDNPLVKGGPRSTNELVFVACFGERAADLLGTRLPASTGIVGRVYTTSRPYVSTDPEHDLFFYKGIDEKINYKTESVIAVPLRLDTAVIGVIQLLNRLGGRNYNQADLALLEIFAQTISSSVVNAVDAQRAVELAKRDDLSGLYNDRYLHKRLEGLVAEAVEQGDDCGLLFMDLDHFKQANDTHGHLVGSAILHEMGFIIRQTLPDTCIPARYGGDEFVVIFPGWQRVDVAVVAEMLRDQVETWTFLDAVGKEGLGGTAAPRIQGEITCSVGVAALREDVLAGWEGERDSMRLKTRLLEISDRRMYLAKARGRNRVVDRDD